MYLGKYFQQNTMLKIVRSILNPLKWVPRPDFNRQYDSSIL